MKVNGYIVRKKFFYAKSFYHDWTYPSGYAIGVNLKDGDYRNDDYFKFNIKGKFYRITKEKGTELGTKFTLPFGIMPNLIPLEEFEEIKPEQPEYEIVDGIARLKGGDA